MMAKIIVITIVVSTVKSISKFYGKITIVRTIINCSMIMLFTITIRCLIIIKIKILFTIIKNINIETLIDH